MTNEYFVNSNIPASFEAIFLKPTTVKITFELITVDYIDLFYDWVKGHPDVFFWKAFQSKSGFGLDVRVARLSMNKEEIPPHERDTLYLKIQEILTGRSKIPYSPYRMDPLDSDEIMFHVTNLI